MRMSRGDPFLSLLLLFFLVVSSRSVVDDAAYELWSTMQRTISCNPCVILLHRRCRDHCSFIDSAASLQLY